MKHVRHAIAWVVIAIVACPLLAVMAIRNTAESLDDRLIGSRFADRTMLLVDRLEMWGKR